MRKKAAEYFSDDPEFLMILITSKVNAATLCYSRILIKKIVDKKDREALSKFFGDAQKVDISEELLVIK